MGINMKRFLKRALAGLLTGVMLISTAFSESAEPTDSTPETAEEQPSENQPFGSENPENMITLPNSMKAVFLTPETDFKLNGEDLTEVLGEVQGYGMNSVIINTSSDEAIFYDFDLSKEDELNSIISVAHSMGLGVYLTLDVGKMVDTVIKQGGGLKEGFSAQVHKFVMKYSCEGILLDKYYTADNAEMYTEYLRSGSGIGYENWLYETNEYIIRNIGEIVHKTSNTTAMGLLIEDMWANKSNNEEGSDTADTVEALYDGFCDTKKYVEAQYPDFTVVRTYGSTESQQLNFENVVSWWNELGKSSGVKTYVCHINERIGARATWNDDQLLRQLAVMEKMDGLGGSDYTS